MSSLKVPAMGPLFGLSKIVIIFSDSQQITFFQFLRYVLHFQIVKNVYLSVY